MAFSETCKMKYLNKCHYVQFEQENIRPMKGVGTNDKISQYNEF